MKFRGLIVTLALAFGCSHGAPPAVAPQPSLVVAVGAKAPDGQLTRSTSETIALADLLHQHAQTIVVFYRGFWCGTCKTWLGELAAHADELSQRDIGVVAISADSVADMAPLQTKLAKITVLTDPGMPTITAWGLRVPGAESPSPGTFVVGRDGIVQWRRLEDKRSDWPTYLELVAALH